MFSFYRIFVLVLALSFVTTAPVETVDIFQAIQNGDMERIRFILAKNRDAVHERDKDQDTPLHYAAVQGNREIIELLISGGADVNASNYQGCTPLHWAASKARLEAAKTLIAHGADVHAKTKRGRTPLFLVAMNNGDVALAKALIDTGADVNTQENSGMTPLSYAPFRGFSDLIEVLLDHGAEVRIDTDEWFEAFHRACSIGHKRLAELMIAKGLDVDRRNEDGRLALHSAAEGGALQLLAFLVEKGNPVNTRDYCGATPLHLAAESGHTEVVRALIEFGASIDEINVMGETPFHLASRRTHDQIAQLLVAHGARQKPPQFPVIRGEYLGQRRPGREPEIFAPGLVSAYEPIHGCVTFTPNGEEIYWSVVDFQKRGSTIYCMKVVDGQWTKPEVPAFASQFSDDVPFCAPGGEKLYFLSSRPLSVGAEPGDENIWVMERHEDGWAEPIPIKGSVNGMDLHWQFSVTEDGTIYFASSAGSGLGLNDIYRSEPVGGEYQAAQNLGDAINSEVSDFAPYISTDESFLIFTSMNRPQGSGLYISFKKEDGAWTRAEYMGEAAGEGVLLTTMSPDGKYLFFTGRRAGRKGVFWVDAMWIEEMDPGRQNR